MMTPSGTLECSCVQHHIISGCCRIDVVTKEDALDFLQVEENKQKTNE